MSFDEFGPESTSYLDADVRSRARFGGVRPDRHPPVPPGLDGLRGLYERYCDRQARDLLHLIPREGLRALYRAARDSAADPADTHVGPADPMALVVRYARDILPLPPFPVWLDAYLNDRRPFLAALEIQTAPMRREPVLVEVRPASDGWMAQLHLFLREGRWGGFLQFTREDEPCDYRTADIFRGEDPEELRRRFREFRSATLDAFLRSVLP